MAGNGDVQLVCDLYEAGTRGDVESVFAAFSPRIEIRQTELLPWGGHYTGIAGAKQFFSKLRENVDSQVNVEKIFLTGERVVAVGRTHGQSKLTGNRFNVSIVHLWTIKEGKVTKFEPHIDTPAMLEALRAEG
jgi:hypothetical protein